MTNIRETIKLTPSQAYDVYVERYPNTTVKKIKLETKSNSLVYKIKGYDKEKKYEIYISPINGTITQIKEKLLKGTHKEITRESTDKIDEMVDRAIEDIGEGSSLYEWTLEIDNGGLDFIAKARDRNNKKIKLGYNLETGEITKGK